MKENKLKMVTNLFEGNEIRSVWDSKKEDYYFSVVDVKSRLNKEGSELVTNCDQLKLKSSDGKYYNQDVLNTEGIFRLIESVPSPKAEPFKVWLASHGKERIDEAFDPEKAIHGFIRKITDNFYNIYVKNIDNIIEILYFKIVK